MKRVIAVVIAMGMLIGGAPAASAISSEDPNGTGQAYGHGEYVPDIAPKAKIWTTGGKKRQKVRVRTNNRHSSGDVGFEPTLVIYRNEEGEGGLGNLRPLAVVMPKKLVNVKAGHAKKRVMAKINKKDGYYILRPGKSFVLINYIDPLLGGEKMRMIDLWGDEILGAYVGAVDTPLIWGDVCWSPVNQLKGLRCK